MSDYSERFEYHVWRDEEGRLNGYSSGYTSLTEEDPRQTQYSESRKAWRALLIKLGILTHMRK